MRALVLTAACLGLLACQPMAQPGPIPMPPEPADACGATALGGLIGGPVSALPATGPWGAVRVIAPGMMVTLDFSATRLNVRTDEAGLIQSVDCG